LSSFLETLAGVEPGRKQVLSVEDWAEIRRLSRAEGLSNSQIARVLGISRNTVRSALASDGPPRYVRRPMGSVADAFEPRIRELLAAFPTMPCTVIAERIGWPYSIRTLSGRVAQWRPAYLPPDPASRTSYVAGEIAQCDLWFPPITLPVGFGQARTARRLPVLTMVCGYSRWSSGLLIPSREAEDLFAGWWQLIERVGRGAQGAGLGRRRRDRSLARPAQRTDPGLSGLRGTLAAKVLICRPGDPEAKGLVERFHDYLERSFLPGRTFCSPADFNDQLGRWLAGANTRHHRRLGCRPSERIEADRQAMLALPPVPPATGWRRSVRLPRDHYVRLDGNDYSVHPAVIGRRMRWSPTCTECERSVRAGWWPTTSGCGPSTRPSPTQSTSLRPGRCVVTGSSSCAPAPPGRRSSSAAWPTTTSLWASMMGWPDEH
jgi:transposase